MIFLVRQKKKGARIGNVQVNIIHHVHATSLSYIASYNHISCQYSMEIILSVLSLLMKCGFFILY